IPPSGTPPGVNQGRHPPPAPIAQAVCRVSGRPITTLLSPPLVHPLRRASVRLRSSDTQSAHPSRHLLRVPAILPPLAHVEFELPLLLAVAGHEPQFQL